MDIKYVYVIQALAVLKTMLNQYFLGTRKSFDSTGFN